MNNEIKISFRVPSDAQSRENRPYLEYDKFITYCNANKVGVNATVLEQYEKSGLLYPCYRVLYPRELLRRDFRAHNPPYRENYKILSEWEPLIELENSILKSDSWTYDEIREYVESGHPLDQAIEKINPYIVIPESQKFKMWDRYKVITGTIDSSKIKISRADHYYSPWKVFILLDLTELNTDRHNRAFDAKQEWCFVRKKVKPSPLNEFVPFFKAVSDFSYRRALLINNYRYSTKKRKPTWRQTLRKCKEIARKLFSKYEYYEWIRFLRKLLEMHEAYRVNEKIRLSIEVENYIARTVIFLRKANNSCFEKVCADVSGKFTKFGAGYENGVRVYAGKLEEIFPTEKRDLEEKVRWLLNNELKRFNTQLIKVEKLPNTLADKVFDELSNEPSGTALAAVNKINYAYFNKELWRDSDVWSGIRDLAVSIEVHGKDWLGGRYLKDVFNNMYPSSYRSLKTHSGISGPTNANTVNEYLAKLRAYQKRNVPGNRRCGRHLLITHITRNLSSHHKGLSGKVMNKNISIISSSLIRTLFVLYAKYKNL